MEARLVIDVPLADIAQAIRGALDVERTPMGLIPLRLPKRLARQFPNAATYEAFRSASGIRLALETRASALELDLLAYPAALRGLDPQAFPVTVDIAIDGAHHSTQTVTDVGKRTFDTDGNLVSEEQCETTVRFDQLPRTMKLVELWFPPNAVVEICALRADASVAESRRHRPRWIHYGSSISHGGDAHSPTRTWPAVAARLADVELVNLGVGGNCHLDQAVARAIRATPATFISLKVGINVINGDTLKYRTFAPAVHGFLDTIREGQPDTAILLVSPIICPIHEDMPGPTIAHANGHLAPAPRVVDIEVGRDEGSRLMYELRERQLLTVRRLRGILEEIVHVRSADDENLHYLSGLLLFNESDVHDLPDQLHPSPDGYVRIGQRFAEAAFGPDGCFKQVTSTANPRS